MKQIRWIIYILISLAPGLITVLLLSSLLDAKLTDFHPAWTDEVDYWAQINSFKTVGFSNGYFSVNELTSNSTFSHYGTHGPMFPMFYGSLGRLLGWYDYSGPLFNIILVCLSLFLFFIITKPTIKQSLFLFLFLLFFYQIYLYIPTNMQESLNTAFAILVSGLLIRLLLFHDSRQRIKIALITIIFFASLFRIIWVFVIFPVFFLIAGEMKGSNKRFVFAFIAGIFFSLVVAFLYMSWTSPYPSGHIYQITQTAFDLKQMANLEIQLLVSNLKKLIGINLPEHETEIFVRYIYLAVIVLLIVNIKKQPKYYLSMLFILVSILLTTIIIYDVGNFRILAPFLLIVLFSSVFVIEGTFSRNVLIVYLMISILTLGNFFGNYKYFHVAHFSEKVPAMDSQNVKGLDEIVYSKDADPWCNSLLTTRIYTPDLLDVPAGIGINIIKDLDEQQISINSHYLLVPYDFLVINGIVSTCETIQTFEEDILCIRINDGC